MLLFCAFGFAQNTLQIKILSDQQKEPLVGATVYIESLDKGVVTNFDGIALLEDIPNGVYNIQISYLGFETLVSSITVPLNDELLFHLKESANALDEVVLQSTRSTRTIKKIPTRIEFIGVEELGEKAIMNPTNISMVLRESTGIQMQQTSLSSANTNIRIQGLDGRYTQLFTRWISTLRRIFKWTEHFTNSTIGLKTIRDCERKFINSLRRWCHCGTG